MIFEEGLIWFISWAFNPFFHLNWSDWYVSLIKLRNNIIVFHSKLSLIFFHFTFQLAREKKGEENVPHLYELEGTETLGSYLQIQPCSSNAPELSECSIQWYRVSPESAKKELITGISSKSFSFFLVNSFWRYLFCFSMVFMRVSWVSIIGLMISTFIYLWYIVVGYLSFILLVPEWEN